MTPERLHIKGSWATRDLRYFCHGDHKVHGPITVATPSLKRAGDVIYVRRMAGAWSYAAEPVS